MSQILNLLMKRTLFISFFIIFINTVLFGQYQKSTNLRQNFIGMRFKDYKELGGIFKVNSAAINLHYGIAHLRQGEQHILLLSKFENSMNNPDDFQLKVSDVVEIPKFNEFYYSVAVKGCSQNGKNDTSLFALAVSEDTKKYLTKVVKVWKLDKANGKIVDYPSAGVKCKNDFETIVVSE